MPRYDYRCETCERIFEIQASMSDREEDRRPECPSCGERETRRVFGSFYTGACGRETAGKT